MKPVAIAATLLLHAAAIGAFVFLHPDQGATLPDPQRFDVALVPGSATPAATIPDANSTDAEPSRIPFDQPSTTNQSLPQQSSSVDPSANRQPANPVPSAASGESAPSSGPSLPAAPSKTGVSIPASYTASNPRPVYPLLSRHQEEQGTVLLRILVKADGTAGEVLVQKSSGYPLLDESARNAVQNWRFHPASINNKAVAEWYQIAIPFKLHD